MDIIKKIFSFLKGLNLKYETDEEGNKSFDLKMDNDPDINGKVSIKFGNSKPTISAELKSREGEDKCQSN